MENKQLSAVEWLIEQINQDYPEMTWAYKDECDQAKAMEKEQLEKELNAFFLFIRNSGEHFIGMPIEQFVKSYLENK